MFKNRVRLPIMFAKPQFPTERNVFRLANGASKVLSVIIRNTYEGKTDQLPEDWHRKLVIAMAHDEVTIENERLMSNVVLDGDYSIDHQEFLNYPIAQATFSVQVTPFDATNSNCQTCDEMTQLNLVDDTTDETWAEGTTHDFPDVVTDNDAICCNPFEITLVTYNTNYFENVSISAGGVLTATVKDPVPSIENVFIATYRVTCPDGSYDEANIYGNISGTSPECPPWIQNIETEVESSTSVTMSWDNDIPAPICFHWELFLTADLGTPIQSGDEPALTTSTLLTGLTAGVSYTFSIVADCLCDETELSLPVTEVFTITSFAAETCGKFIVTYLPYADAAPQSISYMNCAGAIENRVFTVAEQAEICMLVVAGADSPVYFVASSADISINYDSLCE